MKIADSLYGFLWDSMTQNNCNTYLIDGPTRILIDPGHYRLFDHVRNGLTELNIGLDGIGLVLCTHAHPDHIEAVQFFKGSPAAVAIHEKDWQLVKSMTDALRAQGGVSIDPVRPDFFLQEGKLSVNGLDFEVFHTPGHSPGEICLYWTEKKVLVTGDLIFKEGVGRTDLPGGSAKALKDSIRRLKDLDIEYILPGHGDIISGSRNIRQNFEEIENHWFGYL
ncbi:MAG: MBL fold metallo-hydrolase [Desulfobacteraceae bacterium]|nr:MAG: MBL fold metallo-hydrolase [Desulfobacteraceae bacterium]